MRKGLVAVMMVASLTAWLVGLAAPTVLYIVLTFLGFGQGGIGLTGLLGVLLAALGLGGGPMDILGLTPALFVFGL